MLRIDIKKDGALAVMQGPILLAEIDPNTAFLIAAQVIANTAHQVQQFHAEQQAAQRPPLTLLHHAGPVQ